MTPSETNCGRTAGEAKNNQIIRLRPCPSGDIREHWPNPKLPHGRTAVRLLTLARLPECPTPGDGLEALLARIVAEVRTRRLPGGMGTRIVAIDGLGGAGKSSFAEQVSRALDGAPIVHTDDFASWDDPIDWWPRLIELLLAPISRNEVARFEPSRWGAGTDRELVVVEPTEFVILEGVTASREAFLPYVTYSIWIEAPHELRLRRGLERDGQAALDQWKAWMAEEDRYRSTERPDERADVVVRGDCNFWT